MLVYKFDFNDYDIYNCEVYSYYLHCIFINKNPTLFGFTGTFAGIRVKNYAFVGFDGLQ